MTAAARLAAFAALLAIVFAGAALAGDALDADPRAQSDAGTADSSAGHADDAMAGGSGAEGPGATPAADGDHGSARPVRGLGVSEEGLRLAVTDMELVRDRVERLRYRIVDEDGRTVRDFDVEHEKRMHLILARRDLTGFQHLHPTQRPDGSWATRVRLPRAGSYKLFADFTREGEAFTPAADLRVDGNADLRDLPRPRAVADAGAGRRVRVEVDETRAGRPAELGFTVRRGGRTVQVEPYLGADGHLVALREGDMAYLHVHPSEHGDGDSISFEATFPSPGRYRLFLQFKERGRVRTAAFTHEVS